MSREGFFLSSLLKRLTKIQEIILLLVKKLNEINNKKIFDNLKKYFGDKIKINFEEFLDRINKIKLKINNIKLKNIDKAVNIPFVIPIIENHNDVGNDISNMLIQNLKFHMKMNIIISFSNHCSENLNVNNNLENQDI